MSLLPTRTTYNQSASSILAELKSGDRRKQNEFVWLHQDRFYAVALLATGQAAAAESLTVTAFTDVFSAIKQINPKQISLPLWEWLAPYIVQVCQDYHRQYSGPPANVDTGDPTQDGSAQMDWETTVILGPQRVRKCLVTLSSAQQKAFMLRHQLFLDYGQIATVLNQNLQTIMAWLFRARVQIVKCLGRG